MGGGASKKQKQSPKGEKNAKEIHVGPPNSRENGATQEVSCRIILYWQYSTYVEMYPYTTFVIYW